MKNLNDSIYDYKNYSTYKKRNHDEFVVNDNKIENQLFSYETFEKSIISNILHKKRSIYLRFCDGEYIYYKYNTLKDYLIKIYRYFRGRNKTCW